MLICNRIIWASEEGWIFKLGAVWQRSVSKVLICWMIDTQLPQVCKLLNDQICKKQLEISHKSTPESQRSADWSHHPDSNVRKVHNVQINSTKPISTASSWCSVNFHLKIRKEPRSWRKHQWPPGHRCLWWSGSSPLPKQMKARHCRETWFIHPPIESNSRFPALHRQSMMSATSRIQSLLRQCSKEVLRNHCWYSKIC